jgi:O-Antigen ligase
VLIGIVLGWMVVTRAPLAIAAVVGLPALVLCWRRPVYGVLLYLLLMASGVWYQAYPVVPVFGGYGVYPHEVLFVVLFARGLFALPSLWPQAGRLRAVILVGYGAMGSVLLAFAAALLRGQELGLTVNGIRGYMLIGLVPTVAVLIRTEAQRQLLLRAVALAFLVVAVLMCVQVALGPSVSLFPGARLDTGFEEATNIARSHPPASVLATVFAAAIAAGFLQGQVKRGVSRRLLLVLAGSAATILLLSFWRSYWLGAVAGCAVALWLGAARRRAMATLGLTIACVALLVAGAQVLAPGGTHTGVAVIDIAVERMDNIFSGNVLETGTIRDRLYEIGVAQDALTRSPLWGVGPGNPYGAYVTQYRDGVPYIAPRGSAHVSFVSIYLYLGLPGVVAFACLLVGTFLAGLRAPSLPGRSVSSLLRGGLSGAVVTVVVATTVSNWFGNISQVSALALALGFMASALPEGDLS